MEFLNEELWLDLNERINKSDQKLKEEKMAETCAHMKVIEELEKRGFKGDERLN